MTTLEVKFDSESARRHMKVIKKGLIDSVRDTLNIKAMSAGNMQRKVVPRVFTVRNKFIINSLWPQMGKRKGLVPQRMRAVNRMYSTAGSISPLLQKQHTGFSKTDPSVPTDKARVSSSHKRVTRKKYRVKNLGRLPVLRPDKLMRDIKSPSARTNATIAMAKNINWKGLILVENEEALPAGYWMLKGQELQLVRRNQEGAKRRKSVSWHEDSIRLSQLSTTDQNIFNKQASRRV